MPAAVKEAPTLQVPGGQAAESQSTHKRHCESTHPHGNNGDSNENNNKNNGSGDNDKDDTYTLQPCQHNPSKATIRARRDEQIRCSAKYIYYVDRND